MATKETSGTSKGTGAGAVRAGPNKKVHRAAGKDASRIAALAPGGADTAQVTGEPSMAHRASAKKAVIRQPPGGLQLPQGSNAYLAAIKELLRAKAAKLNGRAGQEILRILLDL